MTQPRLPAFEYLGPYHGLNDVVAPSQLGPGWAVQADNVILSDRSIKPRPPLFQKVQIPSSAASSQGSPDYPVSMFEWASPGAGGGPSSIIFIHTRAGSVWQWSPLSGLFNLVGDGEFPIFRQGLGRYHPATWVPVGDWLYMFTGHPRVLKTTGDGIWYYSGLLAATETNAQFVASPTNIAQGEVAEADELDGDYQWAVSKYDSLYGVESRVRRGPVIPMIPLDPGGRQVEQIILYQRPADHEFWDTYRIYRRNATLGEPFVLSQEVLVSSIVGLSDVIVDPPNDAGHADLFAQRVAAGPFEPVKNGVVEHATKAASYKGRVFYAKRADPADPSRLHRVYYTANLEAEHADETDYLDLTDDKGGAVAGLAELNGSLVLLKGNAAHVVTGTIQSLTNAQIAAGSPGLASEHEQRKVPINNEGCSNRYGANGAVVVGSPPVLLFNSESALMAFDGVTARTVTDPVRNLWKEFAGEVPSEQEVSYAVDPHYHLLLICNRVTGVLLCYHLAVPRPDGFGAVTRWNNLNASFDRFETICSTVQDYGVAAMARSATEELSYPNYAPADLSICDRRGEYGLPCPPMNHKSPPLLLAKGLKAHMYMGRWFVEAAGYFDAELHLDNGRAVHQVRIVPLDNGAQRLKGLQRTATQVAVGFTIPTNPGFAWTPGVAANGVALDIELSGQR